MNLRKSSLPAGWYPENPEEITRFLSGFASASNGAARVAVAPHAGWFYSGKIAAKATACLDRRAETLAILGGHLPRGAAPLFAMEDAVDTPLGRIAIDAKLREAMIAETSGEEDRLPDNTVESLLPMVRFFFPRASLLWMRMPDDMASFDAGKALAAVAERLGRGLAVLASADLTHYGPNYGFAPRGIGPEAIRWVREVNDRRLIDAVEAGNPAAVLEAARRDQSTCSAGALVGALGFAQATGEGAARLVEYGTSADAGKASAHGSFVSYAAFAF